VDAHDSRTQHGGQELTCRGCELKLSLGRLALRESLCSHATPHRSQLVSG
jgi:hypothetical protein